MKKVAFYLCPPKFFFLFSLFFTAIYTHSFAATYTSITGTGNWSSNASWTCNSAPCTYPKAGDVVIIQGTITLDAAASIGGTLTSITVQNGKTLILAANVSSNIALTGGILATSGTNPISLTGAITATGGGSITPLATAPLTLSGAISSATSGTLSYSGGNLTAASLSIGSGTTMNIGTSTANSGKLTLKGNATMLGKLVVNKGGTLDASGYTLSVNAGVNGNPACTLANSNIQVDGVVLVDNLTLEKSCMYVSGVNSISTSTPPGFVKIQKNLTINQQGDLQIAGLYLVGGNVDADQGNIDITGTGYFGVAGTADYSPNSAPNTTLNYCENSSILSCPSNSTCPFLNTQNTTNECNNVCRAYVCSGFYASYPLPVDLLSFSATVEPTVRRIRLEWITASETNNDYFAIERSSDGLDFEEISRVKGTGTTTLMNTYTAYDTQPLPGITYYRLKQVDLDGKYAYSKIASALFEQVKLTISPNPTDGTKVGINWSMEVEKATIYVYNQIGQELYNWLVLNPDNQQVISFPQPLKKGVYLLKIHTDTHIFTEKLVVYN